VLRGNGIRAGGLVDPFFLQGVFGADLTEACGTETIEAVPEIIDGRMRRPAQAASVGQPGLRRMNIRENLT